MSSRRACSSRCREYMPPPTPTGSAAGSATGIGCQFSGLCERVVLVRVVLPRLSLPRVPPLLFSNADTAPPWLLSFMPERPVLRPIKPEWEERRSGELVPSLAAMLGSIGAVVLPPARVL